MSIGRLCSQIKPTVLSNKEEKLRRKVMIATAIAMLVGASAAYAASLNSYTATYSFSPSRAGSIKHPSPIGYSTTLTASPVSNKRAAPLVDLRDNIYGLRANPRYFPTCSRQTIVRPPKFDGNCPRGSKVATGKVFSLLGGTDLSKAGSACNPEVQVYNAGGGSLWFFFTTHPGDCGSLVTGATAPYEGSVRQLGNSLVTDVPLPPDVGTAVAGHNGLFGSLIRETIHWFKLTKKVKGKTVAFQQSVGCRGGRRPWTQVFTATDLKTRETKRVAGSAKC